MKSIDNVSCRLNAMRLVATLAVAAIAAGCAVVEPQVRAVIVNDQLVREASASVELERAGARSAVAPGTTLEVGDIVRTGENATAVLLLEDGAVEIVMLENTEIHISSIWVELGEIFVKVKRALRETFEVESEYGVAAVDGTVFSVRVRNSGSSPVVYECTTLEGRVVVKSRRNEWRSLRLESGNAAVINQGNPATQRTLDRREFNELVDRMNRVERTYRPGSSVFIAPNLVGLTLANAQREAKTRGFNLGEPQPTVTGTVAVGEIAAQDPTAGGRLRRGPTIRVDIEVEPATVPSLVGDTVATAQRKLAAVSLRAGSVTEKPLLSGNFDRVIEQSEPPNAKVVPNSQIDLVVAVRGVSVPPLKGKDERAVKTLLDRAGLVLGGTSRKKSNDVPGVVIDQDPAGGEVARKGSRVNIVIEQGCTVPRVIDLSRDVAFEQIRSAGFVPNTRSVGRYSSDIVSGQEPTANRTERCGSTVHIDLGTNIG